MQFYSVKIRLAGSTANEVVREDVSAGEVALLQETHGEGSVVNIKKSKFVGRGVADTDASGKETVPAVWTEKHEREWLKAQYPRVFKKVFLVDNPVLPKEIATDEPEIAMDEDLIPAQEKLRKKLVQ